MANIKIQIDVVYKEEEKRPSTSLFFIVDEGMTWREFCNYHLQSGKYWIVDDFDQAINLTTVRRLERVGRVK